MNLAPTASTTATLALGDALAMALAQRKGFQPEHFADLHPGGRLGRLLMRIDGLMHAGDALPMVTRTSGMPEVIQEISSKRLGMTCVVDDQLRLVGVVTDGDLRRHMTPDLLSARAADVMTTGGVTIQLGTLAVEALRIMEERERKITSVVVVDANGIVQGVVHLHDLWRTQVV